MCNTLTFRRTRTFLSRAAVVTRLEDTPGGYGASRVPIDKILLKPLQPKFGQFEAHAISPMFFSQNIIVHFVELRKTGKGF